MSSPNWCPECERDTEWLIIPSKPNFVQCKECGHIKRMPKLTIASSPTETEPERKKLEVRTPFDYRFFILLGIGMGIFLGSNMYPPYPVIVVMRSVRVLFMGAGLILQIYNTIAYRREMKSPTIQTTLQKGEKIIKHFPGGHRSSKFSGSMGKWYITNSRLIYEGEKTGVFGSDQDIIIFQLRDLVDVKIVKAGRLDKFVEATFQKEEATKKVQILCRKRELFIDTLQTAARRLNQG